MYQIACPTCKEIHTWNSIDRDQRCYKCKYAARPAPEPGGVELQDKINSLELRIEQLNDDYKSQEAFIDIQAEQLRKAKNLIARIALAAGLYLSEDFEL
jgi:hypothetical protein